MKILGHLTKLVCVGLAIAWAGTAAAASLVTPLDGGNENDGVMFDIRTA